MNVLFTWFKYLKINSGLLINKPISLGGWKGFPSVYPDGLYGVSGGKWMGLQGKRVLMVIAPRNFRDEEYFDTKAELEGEGAMVTTASSAPGKITGMLGGEAAPDMGLSDADAGDYDAVVFIGGTGSAAYFQDRRALGLAKSAFEGGKIVAAICIAPSILANAGVLKGRKATSYPSEQGNLKAKGASYTGKPVTRDGRIITGSGPSAAREFGREIGRALSE